MLEQRYAPARPGARHSLDWLWSLLAGLGLFVATTLVMLLTGNPTLYPTTILIGNFLVPVVFVTFLYDYQHRTALSAIVITRSFVIGGVLGVLGASVLEPLLIRDRLEIGAAIPMHVALLIGLIEEGCKLAAVAWMARRVRPRAEIDGLLMGAAVGMGFAALESTGYAFTSFITSREPVLASLGETVLRGLLTPFGHGVWTALAGAALFRASGPLRFRLTWGLAGTFGFVVLLHGLWDGLPDFVDVTIPPGIPIPATTLLIGMAGLSALAVAYFRGSRQPTLQAALTPHGE